MKHSKKSHYKKGFTLVELSIVLVIIGLLIGGILVAESLIGTTKTQTFISQIQQYDVATNTFFDKFNGLPGDINSSFTVDGDADGYIENVAGTGTFITIAAEMANFWLQLSQTGLSKQGGGEFSSDFSTGATLDTDIPKAKLGTNVGIIAVGAARASASAGIGLVSGNYFFAANCSAMTGATIACTDGIKDADALSVDTKVDDGVGTTGDVLGYDGAKDDLDDDLASDDVTAYSLTPSTNQSSMLFRMGSRTGDRK